MKIEIKTCVTVKGNNGVDWVNLVITEKDIVELAKSKALESVESSYYDTAECDEIDCVKIEN